MPKACTERSRSGDTLIELLVVLTILSIVSLIAFTGLKTFSKTQLVDQAISEVQSFLRLAQSNATAAVRCGSSSGGSWSAKLTADSIKIYYNNESLCPKTYAFAGVTISSIKCPTTGTALTLPVTLTYSPLLGKVTFSGSDSCLGSTQILVITLTNLQDTAISKTLTISKGGAINVQ